MRLWGRDYSRREVQRRVADMRQLAGAEPFELVDGSQRGTRGVRLYNAAGLDLDVLADRGMSIGRLTFQGIPLAFASSTGAVNPAYYEPQGTGWLRTWMGGFLTTCGLTQVGSPCEDNGVALGQHGRAANLPARNVSSSGEWLGEEYQVWAQGKVVETAVFGEHVALTRRVRLSLDQPVIWIEDRVENLGFAPAPLMLLQHINLGFPLLQEGSRLELPQRVTQPRDADAEAGLDCCCEFSDPQPGYREQVFYHDLAADNSGKTCASLVNPDGLRVTIEFAKAEYPILVQWKMMGEGMYVAGLEPANCHVGGRCSERERGTLQMIAPRETRAFHLKISFATER